MAIRLNSLDAKLSAKSRENYSLGIKTLHMLIFTLLNAFVNNKYYDSKDRHVIKLFLDCCKQSFQSVMSLKSDVSICFLLTFFEREFATRVPKDRYDIKMMAKLFGNELLKTLQIETSMQRCNVLQLDRVCEPETRSKNIVVCVSGFL